MINLTKLKEIFWHSEVDNEKLSQLYSLSEKSVIATIVVSILMTSLLYPALSTKILWWEFILVSVSIFRIGLSYIYGRYHNQLSLLVWYRLFMLFTFTSASLFSLVGCYFILELNEVMQIFVVTVLIGLSSGAMSSLLADIRILIGYISIIFIPLITTILAFEVYSPVVFVLLIIFYYISQIVIVLNLNILTNKLKNKREQLHNNKLELAEKNKMINYYFQHSPISIFSYDMNMKITDCNKSLLGLFQQDRGSIIGLELANLSDLRALAAISKALTDGPQIFSGLCKSIKGLEYWIDGKCFPIYDEENKIIGGIGLIEDKTKEHEATKNLQYLAIHDPLTSLLNRRGLVEKMNEFMQTKKHSHMYSLLVYLDLNKFKHINDSLGHKVGDELLVSIANRLKSHADKQTIISRFGGDEFIIVYPMIASSKTEIERKALEYIGFIDDVFSTTFNLGDMSLSINAGIGLVIIEPNDYNIDEIIRYADIALYQAKNNSLTNVSFYNEELDNDRKKLFILQHDLSNAAKNSELDFFLQPIVDIKNDKLFAAEALMRWRHKTYGLLQPSDFIDISIETGLISDMTWWLIEEVGQYISKLKHDNIWKLKYISVNINAKQLLLRDFSERFLTILKKYDLKNSDILIEITERSIVDNFKDTQEVIDDLRREGVKCAIDDFGVGYSSLSYLKKLSFDTLKIDMSFIENIDTDSSDIELVKTILSIGRQFNYNIVVEGIEKEMQKDILINIDKNLVYQGYLFSKPVDKDKFITQHCKS